MMYNNKLVYKVVMWVFFVIHLWKEKEALSWCGRVDYETPNIYSVDKFRDFSDVFLYWH